MSLQKPISVRIARKQQVEEIRYLGVVTMNKERRRKEIDTKAK